MMTPEVLQEKQLFLLKCRSGSHAYGLATAASDVDYRGVYYLPRRLFYGLSYLPQVTDATHDQTYYELGRFLELLAKANPTALELLATSGEDRLYVHPLLADLRVEDFFSLACRQTFAGYAQTQIRKARGLNKKVHHPLPRTRKTVVDFCYVLDAGQSVPLSTWANKKSYDLTHFGLVAIAHTRGVYALYYDETATWAQGVSRGPDSNDVVLSSVPKHTPCIGYLSFNRDAYSVYCRQYREYWAWVEARNDDRYQQTLAHGQGYDAKNMMHTLRLLDMGIELFRDGTLRVRRPDRDFLLRVKAGAFTLDDVLTMAEDRLRQLDHWAERSDLPAQVDPTRIAALAVEIREALYQT